LKVKSIEEFLAQYMTMERRKKERNKEKEKKEDINQ